MACGAEQEDNSGAMITKSPALSTLLESWRTKKTGGGLKVALCLKPVLQQRQKNSSLRGECAGVTTANYI